MQSLKNQNQKADHILITYNGTEYVHREGSTVTNYRTNARPNIKWADSKLCISMFDVKALLRSSTLLSYIACSALFFILNWFYSLLAALFGRYLMTLAFLTSWVLQGNPGYNLEIL